MRQTIKINPISRAVVFALFWALYVGGCVFSCLDPGEAVIVNPAHAEAQHERIIKTIIGEAAGEGERGMQAVGEVIRRRTSLKPFKAARRPDLDRFVKNQGPEVWSSAERAWHKSERSNITKDATHFENVRRFGLPRYAKQMKLTAKIGQHWFWREKP